MRQCRRQNATAQSTLFIHFCAMVPVWKRRPGAALLGVLLSMVLLRVGQDSLLFNSLLGLIVNVRSLHASVIIVGYSELRWAASLLVVDFDLLKRLRAASAIPPDDPRATIFFKAGPFLNVLNTLIFKSLERFEFLLLSICCVGLAVEHTLGFFLGQWLLILQTHEHFVCNVNSWGGKDFVGNIVVTIFLLLEQFIIVFIDVTVCTKTWRDGLARLGAWDVASKYYVFAGFRCHRLGWGHLFAGAFSHLGAVCTCRILT